MPGLSKLENNTSQIVTYYLPECFSLLKRPSILSMDIKTILQHHDYVLKVRETITDGYMSKLSGETINFPRRTISFLQTWFRVKA